MALHIAASHLANGIPVKEYVERFRAEKLALEHAHPGGAISETEKARRNVRSSFEISWKLWCAGEGADLALQAGLVALAQSGIDSLGDSLGAALAGLLPADYSRLLAGARRLGLLDLDAVRDSAKAVPHRRLRLHSLMAEFLREKPGADVTTVRSRLAEWCTSRLRAANPEALSAADSDIRQEIEAVRNFFMSIEPFYAQCLISFAASASILTFTKTTWISNFPRWKFGDFSSGQEVGDSTVSASQDGFLKTSEVIGGLAIQGDSHES